MPKEIVMLVGILAIVTLSLATFIVTINLIMRAIEWLFLPTAVRRMMDTNHLGPTGLDVLYAKSLDVMKWSVFVIGLMMLMMKYAH